MANDEHGLVDRTWCLKVPEEEVRFAVVLNGGVSLAVWMGGVVLELDRLTKADRGDDPPSPYALLQRLTGTTCRADVITGTSAGGINGAALALTQVTGSDPATLRDLWIDQGRIETLLRAPFQGQPTSLLKGDEHFLPALHTALEILAEPVARKPDEQAPIDLTITTTVLRGNQSVSVDSTGEKLPQMIHAAGFHWDRRNPDDDPFGPGAIKRTAHRLALAARSSASFPLAFEPSFVPVGSTRHRPGEAIDDETRLRPDMDGVVTSWGTRVPGRDQSRFAVDGGALANTPTRAALEAIERMPAEGPVRRVMLLVFPHAPEVGHDPPDAQGDPPSFLGTLTGLLGALSAQGGRSYVETLERHNLTAAGRRGTRGDVLDALGGTDPVAELESLARTLYPHYRRLRRGRAARDLAVWRTGADEPGSLVGLDLPAGWSFERVRTAASGAQSAWAAAKVAGPQSTRRRGLPYVPLEPPTAAGVAGDRWAWGATGAIAVAEAVSDLLRRAIWRIQPDAHYGEVKEARVFVLKQAQALRESRGLTDDCWKEQPALTRLVPDETYWRLRLACYDHLMSGGTSRADVDALVTATAEHQTAVADSPPTPDEVRAALKPTLDRGEGSVGRTVRDLVAPVIDKLLHLLPHLHAAIDQLLEADPVLEHWQRILQPRPGEPALTHDELLARLLQLEIASTMLGDEVTTGSTLPVELVQISARTPNPFTRYTRTGDDKLGGASINRFGGFLKRSWRVNDWVWGRADGATALARTMLDPKRVRRTALLSGYVTPSASEADCAGLAETTFDGLVALMPGVTDVVTPTLRARAIEELTAAFFVERAVGKTSEGNREGDLPSTMPALADVFAWGLHLDLVPAELPVLAQAVRADRVEGANPRSRGEVFLAEQADLLTRLEGGVPPGDPLRHRALEVFDRAGIGREPLREEASSDLVIRTASTAAAVMSTVVDSDRSGLSAAKPVTRVLRGGMLLPYWAVAGLTARETIARSLGLLALAFGGVLLALALFDVLPDTLSGPAAALGAAAVLTAFAYAALRTGSLLHSVVLLTPLIPLVVYAVTGVRADDSAARGGLTLVVVLAVAASLMLLGSIGFASSSVLGSLDRVADRRGWARPPTGVGRTVRRLRVVAGSLLRGLAGVVVVGVLAVVVRWLIAPARMLAVRDTDPWWMAAGAAGLVLLVAVAAYVGSARLRVLIAGLDGAPSRFTALRHPSGTAATWSVVYGAVYLVLAWLLTIGVDDDPMLWRRVAFATAVCFAATLLVVVPLLLPGLGLRAAVQGEIERAGTASALPPTGAGREERRRAYVDDLVVRGISYRSFVALDKQQASDLTGRGRRLEQQVCDARAAAALRATWALTTAAPGSLDLDRLRRSYATWLEGPGRQASSQAQGPAEKLRGLLAAEQPDAAALHAQYRTLVTTLERSFGKRERRGRRTREEPGD